MTRTAFRATLEITDHDPASPLTAVSAQVEIKDSAGNLANSRFQIEAPTLENIDRIDGNGTIPAASTSTIRWLLIPSDEAAPTTATDYYVGGQFSYNMGGSVAHVPLEPRTITVQPDAALDLVYFHQRDVFSDDPFTPEIEPAIPYALAVMVKNRGAGAAKSLTISSAQPQIVDNQKGLAIEFKLVGAMLNGTNAANSLTLNFGQIDPGAIKIAEWFFTSSLQGFFHNFTATFQHQDTLGNIHLSTIKSVSIHEMAHIVDAGYWFSDGKPDFLVNDVPDPDNLPDTLYFSDGTTNAVQAVQQCSFDSAPSATHLQVQLTAPTPSGWVYLRLPEPSGGQLALAGVTRSDGAQIKLGVNVWTTDRVFPGPSMKAITTNLLHIFDYNSSGIYTLTYSIAAPGDVTPPTSQVAVLPAQTPQQFPVTWSGQDNDGGSGLAYFDIFVSENNGPFLPWLQRTSLRGAIYSGNVGSSYAFYSIATDQAGNRQATPGAANAQTAVSIINHAPALGPIADQTVNEGNTFTLTLPVSDPDLPNDTLTFSLSAGAPPGMTIDSANGILRWATGEADGPGTNLITVNVRDSGNPPLTDSKTFKLVVNEVNSPPTLAPIADQVINAGHLLSVACSATDSDLPAQTLTYSLGAGAPGGMSIGQQTGLLTWRPGSVQVGTTNRVSVVVSDNGTPSLGATQFFAVIVRPILISTIVSASTTSVLAGASSLLHLSLGCAEPVTSLSFRLQIPEDRLANAGLVSVGSGVAASSIQRLSSNLFQATFLPPTGQPFAGTLPLGDLGFLAVSNSQSAIVPVGISAVQATYEGGISAIDAGSVGGRVFVIGDQPILEALLTTNQLRELVLHGKPGVTYGIQYKTKLLPGAPWLFLTEVTLSDCSQELANIGPSPSAIFYRAYEKLPPRLLQMRAEGTNYVIEWPAAYPACGLEETATLSLSSTWLPSSVTIQPSGNMLRAVVPIGATSKFYRLKCSQ